MKAIFVGQDYMIMLDKDKNELDRLRQEKLEAPLTEDPEGKDLEKIVTLELADNDGPDGIEVKYMPVDAESWEKIQRVQVRVNKRAYGHIRQRGTFGTRYGMGDKIEIFNGDPRFEF